MEGEDNDIGTGENHVLSNKKLIARLETEILTALYYSEQEEDIYDGCYSDEDDDDYNEMMVDDDEITDDDDFHPCRLDFYNYKQGKIGRKRNRTRRKNFHVSRLQSRKNSHIDKNLLVLYSYKKAKIAKVCEIRRQIHKTITKNRDADKSAKTELHQELSRREYNKPVITSNHSASHGSSHRNQKHVLRNDNGHKFAGGLLSQLIAIQSREIIPEDFDVLLQLDDSVPAKTVPKSVIDSLTTRTIEAEIDCCCSVCMDKYRIGQKVKYLNCDHYFHSSCIETWLTYNSTKCPLDGLDVC